MSTESEPRTSVPPASVPVPVYLPGFSQPSGEELELSDYLRAISARKWLVIALTLLCTGAAASLAWLMPKKWESRVVMVLTQQQSPIGGSSLLGKLGDLGSFAGLSLGSDTRKSEAVAILGSRAFTYEFIKDENIMPVLFAKRWDAAGKKWNVDNPADVPTIDEAYRYFQKKVCSVDEDKKSGVITLKIRWKDRELAADWANKLVKRLNARMKDDAIGEAQRSIDYLKSELSRVSDLQMRESVYKLMENRLQAVMAVSVRDDFAFKVVDPAFPADLKDYAQPQWILMIVMGFVSGLFGGIFIALLQPSRDTDRK